MFQPLELGVHKVAERVQARLARNYVRNENVLVLLVHKALDVAFDLGDVPLQRLGVAPHFEVSYLQTVLQVAEPIIGCF